MLPDHIEPSLQGAKAKSLKGGAHAVAWLGRLEDVVAVVVEREGSVWLPVAAADAHDAPMDAHGADEPVQSGSGLTLWGWSGGEAGEAPDVGDVRAKHAGLKFLVQGGIEAVFTDLRESFVPQAQDRRPRRPVQWWPLLREFCRCKALEEPHLGCGCCWRILARQ